MSINYKNISATTTTNLIRSSDQMDVRSLVICNTSSTTSVVNLILNSTLLDDEWGVGGVEPTYLPKETYYILKNLLLPKGVTIVLNKEELEYDTQRYDLEIYSTETLDIIISSTSSTMSTGSTSSSY
tara:strand:+ start:3721 stop:4101 length:381 start_codon:yes stop_codon:yes gene_type:complete